MAAVRQRVMQHQLDEQWHAGGGGFTEKDAAGACLPGCHGDGAPIRF